MRRIFICTLLMLLAACATTAEGTQLRPELADPVDRRVQRLYVMSQQDEAFDGMAYNNGYIRGRGCQPVSIANGIIAAFGVEDEQAAAGVVKEATRLLVLPNQQGTGRIEMTRLPLLMDGQMLSGQEIEYPYLAKAIGAYAGKMDVIMEMDTAGLEQYADETDGPFVVMSRMRVYPEWTELIEFAQVLHARGMDDALLCLSNVGVGKEESTAPLRLGKNGHYLTIMLHVGTFVAQGRIYLLDSLPRALEGEESGYTHVLRSPYPFTQEKSEFRQTFEAMRIRETVIRLDLRDEAAWAAADLSQRAELLEPMLLYGPGVLLTAVP